MEEPLQLITFAKASESSAGDDGDDIQLHRTNLDRVLSRTENRPLCVICVGGPSRQGKSFLLGYMIRCLEALEKDETDWMDWTDKNKPLHGFKFRNGTKPETQGIWVWSKPFLINTEEGDPIAVLLVDTQGTYDEFLSARTTASIVGLSLLMSSSMVFNFFKNLQEDVLTSLESYVKYGEMALQNQGGGDSSKPFQKLTFLIRDWNNPAEFPYGAKGGKGFLEQKLAIKEDQSTEAKALRQTMKNCFEMLDCYLMPYPGDAAIQPEFKGSIGELNAPFAKKLEEFISNLINPENLGESSVKTVMGNPVTAADFRSYLETYIEAFNSKDVPTPMSLLEATATVTNQSVIKRSLKKYEEVVKKEYRARKYLGEDKLEKMDKSARKQAMTVFTKGKKFGTKEKLHELEEDLERQLEKQWKEVKKANQEKRRKVVEGEVESALVSFKEEVEMDFGFTDDKPREYYEEGKLIKKAKQLLETAKDDLVEKIGEDEETEESLEQLKEQLQQKLWEWLENKVLLENKNRQQMAEKELKNLVDEITNDYRDNLKAILESQPHLDLGTSAAVAAFQEPHDKMKAKLCERFNKELRSFAPVGKKEPDLSGVNLEENIHLAFTHLTSEHKVRLQLEEIAAQKLVQELADLWKNEIDSAFLSDLEELEAWRDEKQPEFETMFQEQCKLPQNSAMYQAKLELLREKLEGIYDAVAHELQQKTREAVQHLEKAIGESRAQYNKEMETKLEASPFMGVDELKKWHDVCRRNSEQALKNHGISSVHMEQEGLNILDERLTEDFKQLSLQHQRGQELGRSEARNLVTTCHDAYQKEMKVSMERARTIEKLEEGHRTANDNSKKRFQEKCPIKDTGLVGIYLQELEEQNQEAYEEVVELFELKMGEEEVLTGAMKAECKRKYDEEMRTEIENQEFLRPDDLKKLHEDTVKKCIDEQHRKTPLTAGHRADLEDTLTESFKQWMELNDMNLEGDDVAIGIDLGTTYSCVAVYAKGKIRVIPNAQGKNTTPSYVAYNKDGSKTVGEPAKSRAYENPENTIFDAKRILGRKINDEKLQEDIKYWAFSVEDDGGVPKILVLGNKLHPEQVSAEVLKELKDTAEKFLKHDVKKAVITVPAYFTDGQRQATADAGELAGLEVLQVLTEPVAAAMAYKKQHADTFGQDGSQRNTLIFDLGGGTFDVAVLKSKQGELETLAIAGDDHLGGEDFDRALMEHCAKAFQAQTRINLLDGRDSSERQTRDEVRRRLKRLQTECERRKIDLTSGRLTEVRVDSIHGRQDLKVKVTREDFERLNDALFRKTLDGVEKALRDSKIGKDQIHDIVLVGGSTRIPKIQEMLRNYFGGRALDMSINPDEAVAYGAAMKAAQMNGAITRENTDFTKIQDVTPMSMGVEVYGGGFSVIIPKNTKIPVKAKERYKTAHNNQTSVQVTIYQGEDTIAVDNRHLGDFYLNGIPPADAEVENIDVEMTINAQGILHVNAVCTSTGGNTGIRVTENKQRMSRQTIRRLLDEATAA